MLGYERKRQRNDQANGMQLYEVAVKCVNCVQMMMQSRGGNTMCVCVSILRQGEHVLMQRVLETPVEYRTPGGKPLDVYLG